MLNSSRLSGEEKNRIIDHLIEIDHDRNISIINLIQNGVEFEYEKKDGGNAYFFRFKRKRDDEFRVYFCVKDVEELREMKKYLVDADTTFASIPKWIIPEISKGRKILWQDSAYRFILKDNVVIDDNDDKNNNIISNFSVTDIHEEDIFLINSLWPYGDEKSIDYIGGRIKESISGGIYIDGKIAGWCLTHFDNSLAHLFVLEEHRRKDLAFKLLHYMSKKVRESGKTPYLYSVKDNIGAHRLFYKYGYVKSEEVSWFGMGLSK